MNFKKYPYQDFNGFNLDYILEKIKNFETDEGAITEAVQKATLALAAAQAAATPADVQAALTAANNYTNDAITALNLSQYATDTDVTNAITTSKSYTDSQITGLNLSQYATDNDVTNAITTANNYTDSAITNLNISQYATDNDVTNAITTANNYTDSAITNLNISQYATDTDVTNAITTAKNYTDNVMSPLMTPVITDAVIGSPATSSSAVKFYTFGKFVFFTGSVYVSSASANTTYGSILSGIPTPRATWKFTGYGGYSSNIAFASWITGSTLSMRFKSAISSSQEFYISGAYATE